MAVQNSWFKFYGAEYLLDARVSTMSLQAQAVLVRMWCVCSQVGELPDNPQAVAKMIGVSPRTVVSLWSEVRVMFESDPSNPGVIWSSRMREERMKSESDRRAKSEGARKTNELRWGTPSLSDRCDPSLDVAIKIREEEIREEKITTPLPPLQGEAVAAVEQPAPTPRKRRKRLTVDEPGPYGTEIVGLVLKLREMWPTVRGPKAEPMHNDNYQACANIARILADHPSVDLEMLEQSAINWLDTRPSYPNDIQNYFGPGKPGTTPPWLREYRGYATHLEMERFHTPALELEEQ